MDELQTRKGNRGRHQWCKGLAGRWCHASSGATTDKPTSEPHSCSNPSPGKRALSHGTVFQKKVLSDQSALKPASFDVFKRKRLPFFFTEPTFHCKNLLSFFPTPNQKNPCAVKPKHSLCISATFIQINHSEPNLHIFPFSLEGIRLNHPVSLEIHFFAWFLLKSQDSTVLAGR